MESHLTGRYLSPKNALYYEEIFEEDFWYAVLEK